MNVKSLLSHENWGCTGRGLYVAGKTCALPCFFSYFSNKSYVVCNQGILIEETVLLGTQNTCLTCIVSE